MVGLIFMTLFGIITLTGLNRGQSREQLHGTQEVVEKCSEIDWCPFVIITNVIVGLYICV